MQTNAKNLIRHCYALFFILLLSAPLTMHAQMRQVYIDSADNQIERISFLSPSQGYVGFDYWLGYTIDSGRTFTKKYITPASVDFNGYGGVNLTFGFGVNGVKAFSTDTVIVYGDYGLVPSILYSVNGGNTFKLVYYSQYSPTQLLTGIEDMVFPQNTGTGYAIDADRILKTTNRGISWTVERTDPGSFFNYLEAIDDNHVFAFANGNSNPGKLLVTQDGGASWQPASIPAGKIVYINFISLSKGWLNIQNGNALDLYYTQNGGSSWRLMNNPDVTPFLCTKMKFTNDSTGYAIADLFTVYKTTDSGKVWQRVPGDNGFTYLGYSHNDLFFINSNQYWAGGGHGFLELNSNAGGATLPRALFKVDTTGESVGQQVSLVDYSKPNYQYAWYVNGTLISNSYSTAYIHDLYTGTDTIMLLVSDGVHTDTAVKHQPFIALPYPAPVVTSFTPQSGPPGTQVTINGNFFKGAVSAAFGDIPAGSFMIVSPTQIIATVGAGDNGNVSVTTLRGTGSLGSFIVFPPPVISSFAPQSGPIGTTVLITGTNFSAVPGENSVFFGSVRATVTGAAATQLTVTAPAGADYKPITVEVNHHTVYSNSPFMLTFNASCGITEFSFPNVQTIAAAGGYNMTLADFDGDGKTDFAVADGYYLNQLWVMRNTSSNGAISFSDKQTYPISQWEHNITAGDLDGDGKPDLVVTNQDSGTVTVFRNTSTAGAISFVQEGIFATSAGPASVTIRDIDGDGKGDLLVSTGGLNVTVFTVLRNTSINGHINFAPKTDFPTGLAPHDASFADLDGDGKPDLVLMVYLFQSSPDVSYVVYRNTSTIGNISFAAKTSLPFHGYIALKSAVGDIDGDGRPDIAIGFDMNQTALANRDAIGVYRNTSTPGNLSFDTAITYTGTALAAGDIKLADLDGDGKPDLLTASSIDIFKNTSTPGHISFVGALAPPNYGSPLYSGQGYSSVFANDLDNDGRPDLVGLYENIVNVRRNTLGERGSWAGKDTTICQGAKFMLGRQPAAYDHKYAWTSNPAGFSDTVANPIVNPSALTTYYVTVTDWRGCVSTDSIIVNVGGPKPAENAGPDRYICLGDSTQIGSNNPGGNTYSWVSLPQGFSSSQLSPYVKPSVSTTYYLTINTGSCIARDTVQVNISFVPVANAGPDQLICGSGLTQIGTAASNYTTYGWTSSPAGFSSTVAQLLVSPTVTTNYFLVATIGVCTAKDTVVVKVAPRPPVDAGPDRAICAGTPTTLGGTANPSLTYRWTTYNDGLVSTQPNPVFSPTVTTAYDLYVHDSVCYNYDTVIVTVNTSVTPAVSIAVSDSITCAGANVIFTAHPSNGGSSPLYQWQVNGVNAGSNSNSFSSSSLPNGAQVKVVMTGNAPCSSTATVTSNTITMSVSAGGVPSVSISGTVIVNLGSLDTLRAVTINGGPSPVYQWQDSTSTHGWTTIAGAYSNSLIYKPLNTGDKVRCIVTSSSACGSPQTATSAAFVFTVSKPTAVSSVSPASYGLRLYPDPVYSSLTIDTLRITDKWETLAIVSMDGQRTLQVADIRNQLSVTVLVSGLDKGLYVAVLYKKTGEAVYFKFLKL